MTADDGVNRLAVLTLEFNALKAEVSSRGGAQHTLINLDVTIVGTLIGISLANQDKPAALLLLLVPLVSCSIGFLYLDHHTAIQRAGVYLSDQIEPKLRQFAGPDTMNWENYFNNEFWRRRSSRAVFWAPLLLLFVLGPLGASFFTFDHLQSKPPLVAVWGIGLAGELTLLAMSAYMFSQSWVGGLRTRPSSPTVVVVGPISIGWQNPATMKYGGVERAAWRMTQLLASLDVTVVPVGPADSDFEGNVTRRGLWSGKSLHAADRPAPVYADDAPREADAFVDHAMTVLEQESPAVLLLLGPSAGLLAAVAARTPELLPRTIVALHNGPSDNEELIPLLHALSEVRIVALSDIQRRAFGTLARRIAVILDGIPVDAIPFAPTPVRDESLALPARARLISQVDYFHPGKSMLVTLEMFRASGLQRTHHLVLAGGMGWQLPARNGTTVGDEYLDALHRYVDEHDLRDSVTILGDLTGREVIDLYRASELVVSPVRLADGEDPESYGQGRALANACGTPVLMSDRYDPSFAPEDVPELRFSDAESGAARLREWAAVPAGEDLRLRFREFAERTDSVRQGLRGYVALMSELQPSLTISDADLDDAVRRLVRLER